jgi:hypothetical protein
MPTKTLGREELLYLPVVVSVCVALAPLGLGLGLGRNQAYDLIKAGLFPCHVLRLGRGLRPPPPTSRAHSASPERLATTAGADHG